MKIKAMKWTFGLAWRFNRKMLILCCLILSAVSVLPALALMYRRTILGALNLFLQTGEGSMGDILPAILLFGIITALAGLSNRLNDELIYSVVFDSYYFGMEEVLMDSVQGYTMEELLRKDANDEYHACVMREGSLTDFVSGFGLYLFFTIMIVYSLFAVAQGSMTADVLLVIFTLCTNVFTAVSGVARTLMSTDYGLYALERQHRIFGGKESLFPIKGTSWRWTM